MDNLAPKPLLDAVSIEATELIEQSIIGQEKAYQAVLNLALRATTNLDWQDFGGKPYLGKSGAVKVALRLGVSIALDRIGGKDGSPNFVREDFDDENGKLYVYTISGRASFSNGRTVEEIGSASTRDQFLGMESEKDEKGNYVKGEDGRNKQVPVPLHESLQDAKKKCVSNFYSRVITTAIGLGGLGWDDLEKYGISKKGKTTVDFKTKPKEAITLPKQPKGAPFWASNFKGYDYFNVKTGAHFNVQWCEKMGLKTNKAGVYFGAYSETLWKEAEKQFADVEAALSDKEPGSDG